MPSSRRAPQEVHQLWSTLPSQGDRPVAILEEAEAPTLRLEAQYNVRVDFVDGFYELLEELLLGAKNEQLG
jgi:hypothetical protein